MKFCFTDILIDMSLIIIVLELEKVEIYDNKKEKCLIFVTFYIKLNWDIK